MKDPKFVLLSDINIDINGTATPKGNITQHHVKLTTNGWKKC
jgi:hypothetical protein